VGWRTRMRVLGIDCGTEKTGFGVIDSDGRDHALVSFGVIKTRVRDALPERLRVIAAGLREVIQEHSPDVAAVEGVFHAVNTKTALKLAHARGVALLTVAEAGIECAEYSPLEIKTSVVGYGRAEKRQVQLMAASLLGRREPFESEDAADGVAVAICHATRGAAGRLPAERTEVLR